MCTADESQKDKTAIHELLLDIYIYIIFHVVLVVLISFLKSFYLSIHRHMHTLTCIYINIRRYKDQSLQAYHFHRDCLFANNNGFTKLKKVTKGRWKKRVKKGRNDMKKKTKIKKKTIKMKVKKENHK